MKVNSISLNEAPALSQRCAAIFQDTFLALPPHQRPFMLRIINENETKHRVGRFRNGQWIAPEGYPELPPSFFTLEELAAEQLMTDEKLQAKEIRVEEVVDEIMKACMRDIWKLNFLTLGGRAHYACEALRWVVHVRGPAMATWCEDLHTAAVELERLKREERDTVL